MTPTDPSPAENQESLRRQFLDYENDVAFVNAKRAALFSAVFMMAASSLDWIILPEHALEFLWIRIVCSTLIGLIYVYLHIQGCFVRGRMLAQGIALLPMVGICGMIAITDGGNSSYYAGLNLVLVGLSLLLRWNFWNSLFMIIACGVCYAGSVIISPVDSDYRILYGNSFFLFVTSVFVLAGSYFYEKLRFSEFCLRMEVERSRELVEQQNLQLSALDEAKTRFFANISHELRTPLTIMLGITERLRSTMVSPAASPQQVEMTTMLEQNGLRLLKLIDDLLDLVRFDTGHADINLQPTHLAHHTEGLLKSLRHLAEQDRVALMWDCRSSTEHLQIDRDKFDKILLNLVINAIKFTPSGGTIDVTIEARDGRMTMTVQDSGVGIPPEVLPRIFERFWQVDTSSTRKFQGAGIGLALVRSLTEAMGGSVQVESELHQGTTFTIKLPASEVDDRDILGGAGSETDESDGGTIAKLHRRAALSTPSKVEPTAATPRSHMPPAAHIPPVIGKASSSSRPLVLIADDEPDIRRFLRMQMENVDIIEASDGAEAVELARLRRPQLALLDYMMPELDGMEVCRKIRENHGTRGMAVIVLTARADEQTKLSALEAGANDFLTKPFSTAELTLRLENQLAMARIRTELADLNSELQEALEQIKENEALMLQNEKLSALGRMSAGIIHEINNPLNYASVGLHTLNTFNKCLPEDEREDFADIVGDIREGVERVSQIVKDLRQFTHQNPNIDGETNLGEILLRAKRMIGHQMDKSIRLEVDAPEICCIRGNPNQLLQVFINFFQNSIDAIRERSRADSDHKGLIRIEVSEAAERWIATVEDNGAGIPPENLNKIFDPFFTSKDVGEGMGMGLAVTHQILRSHQALVDVDSSHGFGTTIRVTFPKSDNQADTETSDPETQSWLDQTT